MKSQKTILFFYQPITNDWLFWVYGLFVGINAISSYRDFYLDSNLALSGPGLIAAVIDLVVLPVIGTYILALFLLVPRWFYRKSKLSQENSINPELVKETEIQDAKSPVEVKNFNESKKIKKVVVVPIVLVLLFLFDQVARNIELSRLISKVEESESIMIEGNVKTGAIFRNNWSTTYKRWNNFEETERAFSRVATEISPKLSAVHSEIVYLRFLPWHSAISNTRDDYLAHSSAWIDYYKIVAVTNDDSLWSQEQSLQISNTFAAFCNTASKSTPLVDIGGFNKRIEQVCAE